MEPIRHIGIYVGCTRRLELLFAVCTSRALELRVCVACDLRIQLEERFELANAKMPLHIDRLVDDA